MRVSLYTVIKNHKYFLLGLFTVSLVLRVLLFVFFTQHGTNALIPYDSDQYLKIAENIVRGNGIALEKGTPEVYRVPGYPLFLAGCEHALWVQIILASLIPILIFILGIMLTSNLMLAQITACIAAVHLGFVLYAGMIATESLCCLFLLLFFICFFSQRPLSAGIFLGVASLMRPVGHYVLPIAIIMLVLNGFRILVRNDKKRGHLISCHPRLGPGIHINKFSKLLLGWLLIVTPWLLRNFMLTGSLLFHTLPGLHCVQYVAAPIVAQRDACDYAKARAHVMDEWYAQCSGDLNDVASCRAGEKIAFDYVMRYPVYAAKHCAAEIFKSCFGLYSAIILLADNATWPSGYEASSWITKVKRFLCPSVQRTFLIPLIYWDIFLTLFISLGFCLSIVFSFFDKRIRELLVHILPFIALFIALTFAYGGARLRMPAEPLLMLGAVAGWMRLCTRK